MPRTSRRLLPGYPVHVLQRGHNCQPCFLSGSDHVLYLGLLQEFSRRHACAIHAYVLMTNHVHLLVTPPFDTTQLSKMMAGINQVFVQHVNRHQRRCGSIWQGRFMSCLVDSSGYFLNCQRYIEENPVRANMVEFPWLYPWSSYSANASGLASAFITPHPTYLRLGSTPEERQAVYRKSFDRNQPLEELARIRTSVNHGYPLGDDAFQQAMAAILGIRATPGKPGRRPKIGDRPGTDPGFRRQP